MIGPMSSSLALAQRTASKARATMDDMSRQIATGKRVSSAKDDGAAWTRSAAVKSEVVRHQTVADWTKRVNAIQEVSLASMEAVATTLQRGRELVIAAIDRVSSNSSRAAIQTEHLAVAQGLATIAPNAVVDGLSYLAAHVYSPSHTPVPWAYVGPPHIWGLQPFSGDSEYDDVILQLETYSDIYPVNSFEAMNLETADLATLQTHLAKYDAYTTWMRHQTQALGLVTRNNERIEARAEAKGSRLEAFAERLTDADMGKATTARANAETRQQLALSTVSQAISAYGSYANGLLGNVARTQRGLLA
jgi:flagellin-like hook-associated protein FlgL